MKWRLIMLNELKLFVKNRNSEIWWDVDLQCRLYLSHTSCVWRQLNLYRSVLQSFHSFLTCRRLCSGQIKGFFSDSLTTFISSLRSKWPLVFSSTLGSGAEAGAVGGNVGWSLRACFPFLWSYGDSSDGNTWNLGMWEEYGCSAGNPRGIWIFLMANS